MSLASFNRARRIAAAKKAAVVPPLEESIDNNLTYPELRAMAKEKGIEGYYKMRAEELQEALSNAEVNDSGV